MTIFRNDEVKLFAIILIIIIAVFITISFLVAGLASGIITSACCAVLCAAFYFFTNRRYKYIDGLSQRIDMVLHGDYNLEFDAFNEGELSILQNEIQKMVLRLRENAEALIKDKEFLADSLADISHQLRTPMTSLSMLTAFLAKPDADETKRGEFIREAERLLARMDWLLTALLKMSKIDAGTAVFRKEKKPVAALIEKAVEPFSIQLELKNIELRVKCGENISFTGDINWTAEALGNIVKNCMEHAGNTEKHGVIEINCTENAVFAEINISDNGRGFNKEDLPRIFERFYQGGQKKNENYSNYGIGLALCKIILSAQDATIKAFNKPEGGACFTIRFYKQII